MAYQINAKKIPGDARSIASFGPDGLFSALRMRHAEGEFYLAAEINIHLHGDSYDTEILDGVIYRTPDLDEAAEIADDLERDATKRLRELGASEKSWYYEGGKGFREAVMEKGPRMMARAA